jgi:threonylcarbamoyladenosine tRNA methylthiotransferase MtaB
MKFSVLTFGCRANQADSCQIDRELRSDGGEPAASDSADVVVVNTCSVSAAADAAARHAIRSVARANPGARIVATGCYATRRPDEVESLPGVWRLVRNAEKPQLADKIITPGVISGLTGETTPGVFSRGVISPLRPGDRGRTAYPLNVQTGCDERCAYCIVPSTRGRGRSRRLAQVLEDVRRLAAAGFKEVWLTGVHLGSYGRDLRPSCRLLDLLVALDREAESLDVVFRLSSIEPMDCGDDVIDLVAGSARFAPHLHLPLQHASDGMLSAMRRPYTAGRVRTIVERARHRMPDAAIGIDLIAGFPGETDRDFEEQVRVLGELAPSYAHVFPYSDRPGTDASNLPTKTPAAIVRRRSAHLREVARQLQDRFVGGQLGRERAALTLEDGSLVLTDNYLKIRIARGRARNERVRVRIASAHPLRGEVVA